jgi:HPt (histidine-containing phosphotransfer) domain-containing protein
LAEKGQGAISMKKISELKSQIFQNPGDPSIQLEALSLLEQVDPDPDQPTLVFEVITIFLRESKKMISEIEASLTSKDFNTISKRAHSLKSSSASVGALRVSDRCKKLETQSLEQDLSALTATTQELKTEFHMAETDLHRLLKS